MRSWIYSVPGSGTRFTIGLLRDVFGFKPLGVQDLVDSPADASAYTQHHVMSDTNPHNSVEPLLRAAEDGVRVVIPIRSPVATVISRTGVGDSDPLDRSRALWAVLRQTIDKLDHVLLPVEAPWFDHERLLRIVATHVGADPGMPEIAALAREWPKTGHTQERLARVEYDATGRTLLGKGRDSSVLDDDTAWYIQRLSRFFAGAYRGADGN